MGVEEDATDCGLAVEGGAVADSEGGQRVAVAAEPEGAAAAAAEPEVAPAVELGPGPPTMSVAPDKDEPMGAGEACLLALWATALPFPFVDRTCPASSASPSSMTAADCADAFFLPFRLEVEGPAAPA